MKEKFYRPEIAFFWHICTLKPVFHPLKLFLEKGMERKFWKTFEAFVSLRPTDRVSTCRYRCINRPEIAFSMTFAHSSLVFRTLKIVCGEENGRKILKKKIKVLFPFGPIDRVIKIWIPCPRRSRIAWFITSKVSKPRFSRENLVPGERCVRKILKKIPEFSQLYQSIL